MDNHQEQLQQLQHQNDDLRQQLAAQVNNAHVPANNIGPGQNAEAEGHQGFPLVHRVSVKLPPFWPEDVELWFAQVEAQFTIANIVQERTKFAYAVAQLEGRYAHEVRDIIKSPPAVNPYNHLKNELIRRLSLSVNQRLKQILMEEEIGLRKPSQFLRHMQSLAGNTPVHEDLIRQLWLSRLPLQVQAILIAQPPDQTLDQLAQVADKIYDVSPPTFQGTFNVTATPSGSLPSSSTPAPPSICSTNPQPNKDLSELASCVRELTTEIAKLKTDFYSSRSRSYSKHRSNFGSRERSKSPSDSSDTICWYHRNYRNKAQKCIKPCTFSSNFNGSQ